MAIIENVTTAEGDVLLIKPEVPIVGILSLYDFVDETLGENYPTDYYLKEFRYSIDGGLTYSDWMELTTLNISGLTISRKNQFQIEYRYTHVGTSPGVTLTFNNVLVSGDISSLPYPIYNSTYFKDFFEVVDINVYGWALNVLEKLYNKGILPTYLVRGKETANTLEDQDFIDFWNTLTHYFAILVYFARQFRNISLNTTLVSDFLLNKGIEIGNSTSNEVLYLFNNYIQQFADRGTNNLVQKVADGASIDGEFLRLIGYSFPEEFIFGLLKASETGWCIGISSPCWNGTEDMTNLIKGYEFTKLVTDLTKYPLIEPSYISLNTPDMLIQSVPAATISGIDDTGDTSFRLPINTNLDYEISFFAKITDVSTPITFGLRGYDANGTVNDFINMQDGDVSINFFTAQTLPFTNQYYWIRGILKNKNAAIDFESNKVFPGGHNLKFNSLYETKFITPTIVLDNTSGVTPNGVRLYNIKVRPLKTPMTRGQLGMHNLILTYLVNNNKEYSTDKLENIMKQQLIPANSFIKNKYL